jgi:hypothetical protein
MADNTNVQAFLGNSDAICKPLPNYAKDSRRPERVIIHEITNKEPDKKELDNRHQVIAAIDTNDMPFYVVYEPIQIGKKANLPTFKWTKITHHDFTFQSFSPVVKTAAGTPAQNDLIFLQKSGGNRQLRSFDAFLNDGIANQNLLPFDSTKQQLTRSNAQPAPAHPVIPAVIEHQKNGKTFGGLFRNIFRRSNNKDNLSLKLTQT